jgi:hypothetical protein
MSIQKVVRALQNITRQGPKDRQHKHVVIGCWIEAPFMLNVLGSMVEMSCVQFVFV